jgi:hypothetical protein
MTVHLIFRLRQLQVSEVSQRFQVGPLTFTKLIPNKISKDMSYLKLSLLLVSPGTNIVTAMRCTRQAWLQEQLIGDSSDKAVMGQLLHELVQSSMAMAMDLASGGTRLTKDRLVQEVSLKPKTLILKLHTT